uniref:Protein HGH1 N-terminal domain-containing protein n=1 Tax=Noctiluca scintillans TaxID=2966 RepID=A0A7S1AX88_NOCSC
MAEGFAELLNFLSAQRIDVQKMAVEGVLGLSEDADFLRHCQSHPRKVARPLLRLVEKTEAEIPVQLAIVEANEASKAELEAAANEATLLGGARTEALRSLVNLSSVPTVRDQLVALGAPNRCIEAIRSGWLEGRIGGAQWYAMVLANITTTKAGQEAVIKEESLLRFLIGAYTSKHVGKEDPLITLGRVLCNISSDPNGRRMLAGGEESSTLALLTQELSNRGRRVDVLSIIGNFCIDEKYHAVVDQTEFFPLLSLFVYPLEKVSAQEQEALPEALRATLKSEGAAFTSDVAVRTSACTCVVALCRSATGRNYLRRLGGVEVLRAWMLQETTDNRSGLEAVLRTLRLSEKELQEALEVEGDPAGEALPAREALPAEEGPAVQAALPVVREGPLPEPFHPGESGDGDNLDDLAGIFEGITDD